MKKILGLLVILTVLFSCDVQYKYKDVNHDEDGDTVIYTLVKFGSTEGAKIDMSGIIMTISPWQDALPAGNFTVPITLNLQSDKVFTITFTKTVKYTKVITTTTIVEEMREYNGSWKWWHRGHNNWSDWSDKWWNHKGHGWGHCKKYRTLKCGEFYDEVTNTIQITTTTTVDGSYELTKTIQYQTSMGAVKVVLGLNEKGEEIVVTIK